MFEIRREETSSGKRFGTLDDLELLGGEEVLREQERKSRFVRFRRVQRLTSIDETRALFVCVKLHWT